MRAAGRLALLRVRDPVAPPPPPRLGVEVETGMGTRSCARSSGQDRGAIGLRRASASFDAILTAAAPKNSTNPYLFYFPAGRVSQARLP